MKNKKQITEELMNVVTGGALKGGIAINRVSIEKNVASIGAKNEPGNNNEIFKIFKQ